MPKSYNLQKVKFGMIKNINSSWFLYLTSQNGHQRLYDIGKCSPYSLLNMFFICINAQFASFFGVDIDIHQIIQDLSEHKIHIWLPMYWQMEYL